MTKESKNVLRSERLPTPRFALFCLIQPLLQRREVIENRGRVHLLLSRDRFERVRPGTALSHREHRVQTLTGVLVVEDRTAIERILASGRLRQAAMELELQNIGKKIARVGDIGRD